MDFVQDYINILPHLLPPSLYNPLFTAITTALGLIRTCQSHLTPLLTRIVSQPDVTSILLLLAVLFISLKILDMAYRAVMFWVNLVFKLALWGGIALLGLWVYNRGVDGFVEDIQGLVTYWTSEYERFNGEIKSARSAEQRRMSTKGYGYKYQKNR